MTEGGERKVGRGSLGLLQHVADDLLDGVCVLG